MIGGCGLGDIAANDHDQHGVQNQQMYAPMRECAPPIAIAVAGLGGQSFINLGHLYSPLKRKGVWPSNRPIEGGTYRAGC